MDSLIIQDAFAPYYCDREPFGTFKPRKRWIRASSRKTRDASSGPLHQAGHQGEAPADSGTVTEGGRDDA